MLSATGIIRTVDKHSIVTTLLGGGGGGEQFVINFANRPIIFGQDCIYTRKGLGSKGTVVLRRWRSGNECLVLSAELISKTA